MVNVGLEVTLPNNQKATMHYLKNKRFSFIIDACEKRPHPKIMLATWPPGGDAITIIREKFADRYVLAVKVSGSEIYLVLHQVVNKADLVKRLVEGCDNFEQLSHLVYLVVYNNASYYPWMGSGKILLEAVEQNLSPNIQSLMSTKMR